MDSAPVATPVFDDAIGRVALVAQLDTGAAVGFLVQGAARRGPVDQMDDERAGARTVHGRGFPRHALDARARV